MIMRRQETKDLTPPCFFDLKLGGMRFITLPLPPGRLIRMIIVYKDVTFTYSIPVNFLMYCARTNVSDLGSFV